MKLQQKSFLLMIFFCFFSNTYLAQQKQINSLKEKLKNIGLNDSTKIKILGDLGWYYSSFSSDSAFRYSKQALKLSIKTENKQGIAQGYNDIGIIHYRISQFDSSLVYYRKALPIRKNANDSSGIASLYNKIGIAHNQLFKLDSAIYYTLESIKIYEQLKKPKLVAMNLNNVANLYKDSKQYNKALETHKKTLVIRTKLKDSVGYVYSYNGLADVYSFLKKPDSSKYYYKKAMPLAEKLDLKNELSTIQNNLGTLYKIEGNISLAETLFKNSLKIRKSINDNYGIISSYINLADINRHKHKYKLAENQLHLALNKTKKINAKEQFILIYKGLILTKSNLNQSDSIQFYFKKHEQIKDSLYNNQIIGKVADIETKYQTVKKEKEIAQQKEQLLEQELAIKNRNLYASILASALIILAIIFFSIYKRNQLKRKQLQKEIDLNDALSVIKTQNRLQEQRLRISRDLHDNIGSQLTFIISSIGNLKYITKDTDTKLKDKLSSISSFTGDTIHQLRDTIWAMNKSEISIEDLHTRILSFIEKAKMATKDIQFIINQNTTNDFALSSIKGMNIFRVIQEAINNSIKYANASKIEVSMNEEIDKLTVIIEDNGAGFDKNTVELGNGLSNMEKRMSEVDGKVQINSEIGVGTNIVINCNLI